MYLLYGFGTVSGCGQDPSGRAVPKQEEKVRNRTSTELLKGFLLRIRTRETLGQVMRSVPSEVIPAHEASDAASHLLMATGLSCWIQSSRCAVRNGLIPRYLQLPHFTLLIFL
jgi:hypothetical protein